MTELELERSRRAAFSQMAFDAAKRAEQAECERDEARAGMAALTAKLKAACGGSEPSGGHDWADELAGLLRVTRSQRDGAERELAAALDVRDSWKRAAAEQAALVVEVREQRDAAERELAEARRLTQSMAEQNAKLLGELAEARAERDALSAACAHLVPNEMLMLWQSRANIAEARLTRVREMLTVWLDPRFSDADGATKVTTIAVRALLNVLAGTR